MSLIDRINQAKIRHEEQQDANKGVVNQRQQSAAKAMADKVARIAAAKGMTIKELEEAMKKRNK